MFDVSWKSPLVVAVGLASFAACGGGHHVDTTPVSGGWTADVQGVGGHSLSGFATVTLVGADQTRANLTLSGAQPGTTYDWRLRAGACGDEGAPIQGTFPELETSDAGTASATVTLDQGLDVDGSYTLEVVSDDQVVACGDMHKMF